MSERGTAEALSWRVLLAFGTLGVIWGVPYFFIRIAVQEVSPLVVVWGRLTFAALVLLPIALRRGALRPLRRHLGAVVAFALVEFVGPFTAISYGERWISSAVTAILIAGVPLTIAVISRFFGLHERLGFTRAMGLLLGLLGVIVLSGSGQVEGATAWAGVGCMVLATLGYAIGPIIIQRHLKGLDSIGPVAASLTVASGVMLPPALLAFPHRWPSPLALSCIAVLGLLCSAAAMLLMFYLVRHAGAARSSVVTYINPVVAALLGVGLLHEHLGWGGYIAFDAILIGSWLATRGAVPARDGRVEAAGRLAGRSSDPEGRCRMREILMPASSDVSFDPGRGATDGTRPSRLLTIDSPYSTIDPRGENSVGSQMPGVRRLVRRSD